MGFLKCTALICDFGTKPHVIFETSYTSLPPLASPGDTIHRSVIISSTPIVLVQHIAVKAMSIHCRYKDDSDGQRQVNNFIENVSEAYKVATTFVDSPTVAYPITNTQ